MAAPLNYNIYLVDTTGGGLGPYTMTVLKNPTAASGGTDITANCGNLPSGTSTVNLATNPTGVLNPLELANYGIHAIGDDIASANQSDGLN